MQINQSNTREMEEKVRKISYTYWNDCRPEFLKRKNALNAFKIKENRKLVVFFSSSMDNSLISLSISSDSGKLYLICIKKEKFVGNLQQNVQELGSICDQIDWPVYVYSKLKAITAWIRCKSDALQSENQAKMSSSPCHPLYTWHHHTSPDTFQSPLPSIYFSLTLTFPPCPTNYTLSNPFHPPLPSTNFSLTFIFCSPLPHSHCPFHSHPLLPLPFPSSTHWPSQLLPLPYYLLPLTSPFHWLFHHTHLPLSFPSHLQASSIHLPLKLTTLFDLLVPSAHFFLPLATAHTQLLLTIKPSHSPVHFHLLPLASHLHNFWFPNYLR